MAINFAILDILRKVIASVPNRPLTMVTAGYPDILVTREHLEEMFDSTFVDALQVRPDSESIIRWHRLEGKVRAIYETRHFFSLLGVEITSIDIVQARGDETIQDLNGPLQPGLEQKFDIVFDGGTLEHCFNIAQAVRNFLGMAKVGGYILHANPFNMPNHGFYNLNPTFYADFYESNGHRLASEIRAVTTDFSKPQFLVLRNTARFSTNLPEATLTAVAQKQNDRPPIWPIQTKYRNNPTLAG